uniref:Uncharacterized protein n=1 Tax=Physcomitrium patens TaxID=3218 RepID=A0A2K1I9T8_PHYPA|nr:hypothetical protein PHYPA_031189 [Physcomitrium patens]
MQSLMKVVLAPRTGSATESERRKKKKEDVLLERSLSSSTRYPSMPRYPLSPLHGEVDVSEIRKANLKVIARPGRRGDLCCESLLNSSRNGRGESAWRWNKSGISREKQ